MSGPVLFFDGVCNLCNASVRFVIRHDRRGIIRFASLQSAIGQAAIAAVLGKKGHVPDSLILLDNGCYYTESDAALRVARYLDGGWRALYQLRMLPRLLRDAVYRLVSRNRYRWFGRKDACMIPSPELKQRFLD